MGSVVDATRNDRQARWRDRRRTLADQPAGVPKAVTPTEDEREDVRHRAKYWVEMDKRLALRSARATMADKIEEAAGPIADKMIQLALQGDCAMLVACARTVLPPAKDERRIKLDIPALTPPGAVAVARQRVAEAVAAGELPLGDATQVMELLV